MRPVVWLSGVRQIGKTTLARMLPGTVYLNCDNPYDASRLQDPIVFLDSQAPGTVLVLDEAHRLADPSLLLKLIADEYPGLKVLATGSSTLAATRKFSDSLTGRKCPIHLCPVLWEECSDPFGRPDLDHRLLNGGLPASLLAARRQSFFFSEWIDSFYARDVLELFGVRKREGFLALFRLLLRQSGGQLDISKLARLSELSRPTVRAHLDALQIAHAVHLLRPFHGGGNREIVSRPKCYAFDTGLVAHEKGWDRIRSDDRGLLWEHLVLDTLRLRFPDAQIFHWRDKSGRAVDFVVRRERERVDLVECKINPDSVDASAINTFRESYPKGENYIASPAVKEPYRIRRRERFLTVCRPAAIR